MKELPPFVFALLSFIILIIRPFQLVLLYLSSFICQIFFIFCDRRRYFRPITVGVTETARMIFLLGKVFPSRYSVVLDNASFYQDLHSFGPYHLFLRPFIGPLLLAFLAEVSETFVYISSTGFCADRVDDLAFLKRKGKKVVLIFVGSDIRSLKLSKEFFDKRGEDSYANYLPNTFNLRYDARIKRTARAAERYADLVLNWKYDQIGYLTIETVPWPYIVDLSEYGFKFNQIQDGEKVIILHAPSSPMTKGTQIVRSVIKKFQLEGYDLDYRELINVPHTEVLRLLGESQIVLQEFYFITPGVLGIEALARGNAVLMAAGHEINPELPLDADQAWIPTRYWEIYDKLKMLLDTPSLIETYALRGRKFVESHYQLEVVREFYREEFARRNIPFE